MVLHRSPDVYEKLHHLGGMATDDILVPSAPKKIPGSTQSQRSTNMPEPGIYKAAMPNGKRISLLRVMFSDHCMMDCHYCPNSYWVPRRRYGFTVDELARLFDGMQSRHQVAGLFLSSGIFGSADQTMERLLGVVSTLRRRYKFPGYIHLKVMPGASDDAIREAATLGTRLSINMETPSRGHLEQISGMKDFDKDMLRPMQLISNLMSEKYGSAVGQATQLVVGAADETDWDIYLRQRSLYNELHLKRVYYNAFRPIQFTPLEMHSPTLPIREHRLYQMDWLSRVYKFSEDEMRPAFGKEGHLSLDIDPKLAIAMNQIDAFPVDVNAAEYEKILRVPGIGPLAASRIIKQRENHSITRWQELKSMGVVVKRALPFIRYKGHKPEASLQSKMQLSTGFSNERSSESARVLNLNTKESFDQVHRKHIQTGCSSCPLHKNTCGGIAH